MDDLHVLEEVVQTELETFGVSQTGSHPSQLILTTSEILQNPFRSRLLVHFFSVSFVFLLLVAAIKECEKKTKSQKACNKF